MLTVFGFTFSQCRRENELLYKYNVSGHYPSSYFCLKIPYSLNLKTERFGDWILSSSLGKSYSVWLN
jgi:hypothetical protein